MINKWSHPNLGEFSYEDEHWSKLISLPSFNKFKLNFNENKCNSDEISFYSEDVDLIPTINSIKLLNLILSNQEKISNMIVKVLWDDFHGTNYNSGMWWHGAFDEVFEYIEKKPTSAEELFNHLSFSCVTINNSTEIDDEEPIAEISFEASFEEEHGVSVLTDGIDILGTGYILSVTPFKG